MLRRSCRSPPVGRADREYLGRWTRSYRRTTGLPKREKKSIKQYFGPQFENLQKLTKPAARRNAIRITVSLVHILKRI